MFRLVCLISVLLATTAAGQGKKERRARTAFRALHQVTIDCAKRQAHALERFQATPDSDAATRAKWHAEHRSAQRDLDRAKAAFHTAFATCRWNTWKLPQDALLLEQGLAAVARRSFARKPQLSVRAWDRLRKDLPGSASAIAATLSELPRAVLACGDAKVAARRISQLIENAKPEHHPDLKLHLADAYALGGETQRARELAVQQLTSLPVVEGSGYDPRVRLRRRFELRASLLGRDAPSVDSKDWLGRAPSPFASLKGKVLLLDFWGSWCGPCRGALPHLDELQRKLRKDFLVLGITRPFPTGFLPASRNDLRNGKSVADLDRASWRAHLTEFHEIVRPSYPFVVASEREFADYRALLIPTLVVVDKKGIIRFAATGDGHHHVLKHVVRRYLRQR